MREIAVEFYPCPIDLCETGRLMEDIGGGMEHTEKHESKKINELDQEFKKRRGER